MLYIITWNITHSLGARPQIEHNIYTKRQVSHDHKRRFERHQTKLQHNTKLMIRSPISVGAISSSSAAMYSQCKKEDLALMINIKIGKFKSVVPQLLIFKFIQNCYTLCTTYKVRRHGWSATKQFPVIKNLYSKENVTLQLKTFAVRTHELG